MVFSISVCVSVCVADGGYLPELDFPKNPIQLKIDGLEITGEELKEAVPLRRTHTQTVCVSSGKVCNGPSTGQIIIGVYFPLHFFPEK